MRSARRWLVVTAATSSMAVACDGGFDVENGRPRVTWVAVEPLDDDSAALTLWVKDAEGEAVDATITWSANGQSGALVLVPGSAPLSGLPTVRGLDDDGQASRVTWDLSGVPAGAVTLSITVDDRPFTGDAGDLYVSEPIDPRVGGGPVALTR